MQNTIQNAGQASIKPTNDESLLKSESLSKSARRMRILMIDPEEIVRHAIGSLINSLPDFEVHTSVSTSEEGLKAIDKIDFDIVILEIALPQASGIDFLHELQRRKLLVKTLVLSHLSSPELITQALLAGAQGFALKAGSFSDLCEGLQIIKHSNKRYLPPQVSELARIGKNEFALSGKKATSDPLSPLSKREREIFHLLATGLQNTAIAKKLFISPRTVETHRARIVRKLGLCTNGELIRFAIKNGLTVV